MKLILQAIKALLSKINTQLAELAQKTATPDWNAAEGESGHVLNRTHYMIPGGEVILPETEFTGEGLELTSNAPLITLEEGRSYTVTYNGVEYICETKIVDLNGNNITALGNTELLGGERTEEPFMLLAFDAPQAAQTGTNVLVYLEEGDTTTSATVSIVTRDAYKTLDPEYIPASLPQLAPILWVDAKTDDLRNPTSITIESGHTYYDIQKALEKEGKDVIIHLYDNIIATDKYNTYAFLRLATNVATSFYFIGFNDYADGWIKVRWTNNAGPEIAKWRPGLVTPSTLVLKASGAVGGKRYKILVDNSGNLSTEEYTE